MPRDNQEDKDVSVAASMMPGYRLIATEQDHDAGHLLFIYQQKASTESTALN